MRKITEKDFFTIPAEKLAERLLGKIICHKINNSKILKFKITETEAYGKDDPFCHSNKYKNGNGCITQKMIGGTIYVHNKTDHDPGSMFDIVAGKEGDGEGVLIRSAIDTDTCKEIKGPRNLGFELKMTFDRNKEYLLNSNYLWIEENEKKRLMQIKLTKRIELV